MLLLLILTICTVLYSLIAAVALANAMLILRLAVAMLSSWSDGKSRNI